MAGWPVAPTVSDMTVQAYAWAATLIADQYQWHLVLLRYSMLTQTIDTFF